MRDPSRLLILNGLMRAQEVMVVSKKGKKRRPLSLVVQSSGERLRRSPYRVHYLL